MADNSKELAFDQIDQFVTSLTKIYKEDKPLIVFNALVEKIKSGDQGPEYKELVLKAFNKFYKNNKANISAGTIGELPKDTSIEVTSGMKLNVTRYYIDADIEDRANISKTLLTIGCLLNPEDNDAFQRLEDFEARFRKLNVDGTSKEGAFVNSVVDMAINSMQNIDPNNPQANLASIGQSLPKLMSDLQTSMEKGEIDPQKMVGNFQSMLGSFSSLLPSMAGDAADFLTKGDAPSEKIEEVPTSVDDPSVPVIEPRGNVMGENGMPSMTGMMNMMKMVGQASQGGGAGEGGDSVEEQAAQSAMFSSIAQTVTSSIQDAMSAASDD